MVNGTFARTSHAASSSSSHDRPRAAVPIGSGTTPCSALICSAAPSAVPESPAAGCTQTCSKGVSRQMRVFATQFSAVPPAIVSRASPVRSCSQVARSTSTSSVSACTDAARSACSGAQSVALGERRGAQRDHSGSGATNDPSPVACTSSRSSARCRGSP